MTAHRSKAVTLESSHAAIPRLCKELYESLGSNVSIVQVGANDGQIADPLMRSIRDYSWRALLIEPVPFYFAQLEKLYQGARNATLVRMAVDTRVSKRAIFVADPAQTPSDKPWWKGLASFNKAHLNRHLPAEAILEIDVSAAPLSEIMSQANFTDCNILCVDVEGHELVVLDTFDFEKLRPAIVAFESKHMSADQYSSVERMLSSMGYIVRRMHPDSVAIHSSAPVRHSI